MLKLATGQPGAGKTANELWKFLHAPEYKNRPKYCTPVNGFEPEKHGVKPIEHISCWQDLPEGSVIFCDEVQDYCGTDLPKVEPEWVKQLARHRHSGYDFIFTTQSPMFLHSFVRKLVQPHVHYANPFGMKYYVYQWETVQNDPNAKSAKAIGQRQNAKPNPEVYSVYTSTVLDTHKARPPYKILITFALIVLVCLICASIAFMRIRHIGQPPETAVHRPSVAPQTSLASNVTAVGSAASTLGPSGTKPVWTKETTQPRIAGEPFTAPVYDNLTAPTDFPRVAGCIASKVRDNCNCYTQQGTPLDVPRSACEVFVKVGTFDPWLSGRQQQLAQQSPKQQSSSSQAVQPVVLGKSTIADDIKPAQVAQVEQPSVHHFKRPSTVAER